jgi:hypothetical protein
MAHRGFGAWPSAASGLVCWGRGCGISGTVNVLLRGAERGYRTSRHAGPEMRTMAIPARPGAVESA